MSILFFSIILNIILGVVLITVKKQSKRKRIKIKELESIADNILYEQIKILSNNDYAAMSVELEMSKYLKDVIFPCIVDGKFTEQDKKRLHQCVCIRYPNIFEDDTVRKKLEDKKCAEFRYANREKKDESKSAGKYKKAEKDIKRIELHFEDDTVRKIDHGFICEIQTVGDAQYMKFDMCHISGKEIKTIVYGILELGKRLGILPQKKEKRYSDIMEYIQEQDS